MYKQIEQMKTEANVWNKEKERMLTAIDQLVDIIFEAKEANERAKGIAIKAINKGIDKETVAEITGLEIEEVEALA